MSGQIFISYRREESQWAARSIYDRLAVRFGRKQIFIDVDTLKPGVDFVKAIEKRVGSCDVLIAVIGARWISAADGQGRRRLDNPEDLVRAEIAAALSREVRVIPVLTDGASMPGATELPDDLKPLVRRNALPVTSAGFDDDYRRLVSAIEEVFKEAEAERRERKEKERLEAKRGATEAKKRSDADRRQKEEQERLKPEPHLEPPGRGTPAEPIRKNKLRPVAGIVTLLVLVVGLAVAAFIYFGSQGSKRPDTQPEPIHQPPGSGSTPVPPIPPKPIPKPTASEGTQIPIPAPTTAPAPSSTTPAPAQASDVSYALTTTTDPAQPGKVAQFTVTATNLTASREFYRFTFHVPKFTTYSGYAEGAACNLALGPVPAGASLATNVDLKVLGGNQSPPDGSIIALALADIDRGKVSISRSVTVIAAPRATLALSTGQGTVASGGAFSYTLVCHNAGAGTLTDALMSLQVPVGASFVSADKGGLPPGSDGVVRWPLETFAAGSTLQAHVTLKASTANGAQPALLVQAALSDSGGGLLAQASDVKAVYATPTFSYALATTTDPAQPGKVAQFTVNVTNLTDSQASCRFTFHVPKFSTYSGYAESALCYVALGPVPAGASLSTNLDLTVLGGNQSAPDGSIIALALADIDRGASVSHSVTVKAAPVATLELLTGQGTVAPGGALGYTLACHNAGADTLTGALLSLRVPAGASFVSADGGGVPPGSDGVVRWALGTFAPGSTLQTHVTLKALTATGAQPALPVQAALSDSGGNLLAQASDVKAVYATPAFSYALATTTDPAQPGKVAQFTVTVTNLTDSQASCRFTFHVPRFTTYGGYAEGALCYVALGPVAPGASLSTDLDLTVLGGNQSPPDGSIIALALADIDRGASVSHSVTVKAAPVATLELLTGQGTVAPGGALGYTLACHNAGADTLTGALLSLRVPAGASFVSADGGGVPPGSDGVVRWALGTFAPGSTLQTHVTLKALTATGAQPALPVQAALSDSGGNLLAQASDVKAVYATPTFSYTLATTTDPVLPGKVAQFTVTVTNLTDSRESCRFTFHVPRFTTYGGRTEGAACYVALGPVAPGASLSTNLDLTVLGGNQSPPDGSVIALALLDPDRGASVSHSIGVSRTMATLNAN